MNFQLATMGLIAHEGEHGVHGAADEPASVVVRETIGNLPLMITLLAVALAIIILPRRAAGLVALGVVGGAVAGAWVGEAVLGVGIAAAVVALAFVVLLAGRVDEHRSDIVWAAAAISGVAGAIASAGAIEAVHRSDPATWITVAITATAVVVVTLLVASAVLPERTRGSAIDLPQRSEAPLQA